MMNTKQSAACAASILTMLTLGSTGQAAIVIASARDGSESGSNANNAANGSPWSADRPAAGWNNESDDRSVNGVTTTTTGGAGNGGTPALFTYNVVDTTTGVDFDFQVSFTAFTTSGGGGWGGGGGCGGGGVGIS